MGDRRRAAPRAGCGAEDALSTLREFAQDRRPLVPTAARLSLGSRGCGIRHQGHGVSRNITPQTFLRPMASLSDKAGFLITANFIKYAVGFVLPMLMVRVLNQSDYGTYQQLLLVNSMALGLLTLGLPSSIYY